MAGKINYLMYQVNRKGKGLAGALVVFLMAQNAWCFTTGIRSLDYLFGTTWGIAIAVAEFIAVIAFIFQLLRIKKGHEDELWNLAYIFFAGVLIWFVPDIFGGLANISGNAGVQGTSSSWNGSNPIH